MIVIREISKNDCFAVFSLICAFGNQEMLFLDDPFSCLLGAYCDEDLIGYMSYSLIYDRAEINYITVLEQWRRQGIGSLLMKNFIDLCVDNRCMNVTLEVNEHNDSAIALYSMFGFSVVSRRNHYYFDGDGYVMMKEFDLV